MAQIVDNTLTPTHVMLFERRDWSYGQKGVMIMIPVYERGTAYNVANIGFPEDVLSGIRIPPFTKVTLWDGRDQTGNYVTLTAGASALSIQDLKNVPADNDPGTDFEDRTKSIMVVAAASPELTLDCCKGGLQSTYCGAYQPGGNLCTANMRSYCSTRMGSLECQQWCRDNPGKCDTEALNYCKTAPAGNLFCACINSPIKGLVANPTCLDMQCMNSGYKTAGMLANCPPITSIECTQINNIAAGGKIMLNQFNFTQSCGASSPAPVNTGGSSTQTGVGSGTGSGTGSVGGTQTGTGSTTGSQHTTIAGQGGVSNNTFGGYGTVGGQPGTVQPTYQTPPPLGGGYPMQTAWATLGGSSGGSVGGSSGGSTGGPVMTSTSQTWFWIFVIVLLAIIILAAVVAVFVMSDD